MTDAQQNWIENQKRFLKVKPKKRKRVRKVMWMFEVANGVDGRGCTTQIVSSLFSYLEPTSSWLAAPKLTTITNRIPHPFYRVQITKRRGCCCDCLNSSRRCLFAIVTHTAFDVVVIGLIVLNSILIMCDFYGAPKWWSKVRASE